MTAGRVQLPDGPIYVPEDSEEIMQALERASPFSIVDGSLNPVPLSDLDQMYLIEMYIGTSKYQVGSGSMCILLALLLCRVKQRWHCGVSLQCACSAYAVQKLGPGHAYASGRG